ncbi:Transcription repressor [Arachis hypogaea]|nr:Transcription repressor [Arachis hypogaea]
MLLKFHKPFHSSSISIIPNNNNSRHHPSFITIARSITTVHHHQPQSSRTSTLSTTITPPNPNPNLNPNLQTSPPHLPPNASSSPPRPIQLHRRIHPVLFLSSSLTSSLTTTAPAEASSASAGDESKAVLFEGSVAVTTYSPDPYLDFRQSMEEMVEARPELMADVKSNWHVLQELLMCYLALNPKSTHKFILGAFADLLVTRMAFSDGGGSGGEE